MARRTTPGPQSDAAAEAPAGAWIQSPAWDCAFVLGTPLLCLAVVAAAPASLSSLDLWLFVMAFGAMGHHFPGFLRAYTDPALFARFRLRFLLAPPLVFGTVFAFAHYDLHGMVLVVALWGLWHGMMQHFGFMRIYDAKVGARNPKTARWDWWMCLAWFGGFVAWNPGRLHGVLDGLYRSGLPLLPASSVQALPWTLGFVVAATTAGYLRHLQSPQQEDKRRNPIKLVLLFGVLLFLALDFLAFDDLLLGLVAWELYHDIQYLAVVWIYNQKRASQGSSGWALRWLFGPGLVRILLYIGLCLLWGGSGLVFAEGAWGQQILAALLSTSALLHFYYDGFIWKVREASTSQVLGLTGGKAAGPGQGLARLHAAGALAAVAALLLGGVALGPAAERERLGALALSFPGSATAQLDLAVHLRGQGKFQQAKTLFVDTIRLDPNCARAHNELGILLNAAGDIDEAARLFGTARDSNPAYAPPWSNLAMTALRQGHPAAGQTAARRALERDPSLAEAHNNLGVALALSGDPSAAEAALRRAQALEPGGSEAADNLQALARAKVQGIIDPGYRLAPAADLRPQGVPAGALCPNHTNKPRLSAIPGARPSWTEPAG